METQGAINKDKRGGGGIYPLVIQDILPYLNYRRKIFNLEILFFMNNNVYFTNFFIVLVINSFVGILE